MPVNVDVSVSVPQKLEVRLLPKCARTRRSTELVTARLVALMTPAKAGAANTSVDAAVATVAGRLRR